MKDAVYEPYCFFIVICFHFSVHDQIIKIVLQNNTHLSSINLGDRGYSGRETGYFMCIYIIITFFVKNINTDVPAELVLVRCLFECRDFIDQQIHRLGLKNIEIQVCCLKKLLTRYCFLRRVRKAGINILLQRIFFRICRYRKRRNEAYFRQGNTAEGKRRGCKK